MPDHPVYQRVLLKLSGEALMGRREYGLDNDTVRAIAADVRDVVGMGVQVCIVIGGGNIFRGVSGAASGMERAQADFMGMLATVMNALAMQSAIPMSSVCEPYIRRRAERHMEKGRVVIFAAGTGNPFFTTDTAAALRALEINAEGILMAKHGVEGVLDGDPRVDPDAELVPELTHLQAIERGLKVMDTTALSLCMDNRLPIYVFALEEGNIRRVVHGERVGTIVSTH